MIALLFGLVAGVAFGSLLASVRAALDDRRTIAHYSRIGHQ